MPRCYKLSEELDELRRAALEGDGDPVEELGDVLFAAVCVGRFLDADPEDVGLGGLALLLLFQLLPVGEDFPGGGDGHVPEHVGVAVDQLFADAVGHSVRGQNR